MSFDQEALYKCSVCNADSFPRDYCNNCCPKYCVCGGGYLTACPERQAWLQNNIAVSKNATVCVQVTKQPTDLEQQLSQMKMLTLETLRCHRARLGDCAIIFVLDLPEPEKGNEKERLKSLKTIAGALILTGDATFYSPFSGTLLVPGFADMSSEDQAIAMRAFGTICIVKLHCFYIIRSPDQKWQMICEKVFCTLNNATGEIFAPNDFMGRSIWFRKI